MNVKAIKIIHVGFSLIIVKIVLFINVPENRSLPTELTRFFDLLVAYHRNLEALLEIFKITKE